MYSFVLYVNGRSARAEMAIRNLTQICDESLPDNYDLTVVDLHDDPSVVTEKCIIVSPTLDREAPQPQCRVVGDLSNRARVLEALGIPDRMNHVSPQ